MRLRLGAAGMGVLLFSGAAAAGMSLLGAPVMSEAAPAIPEERIHVAQNAQEAQLALRIQQLEEQIRTLTGQVEGLQFQLTQMQTLIERTNEDNEFRFQALEGGASPKTDAATQSGGVTPPAVSPQSPNTSVGADPSLVPTDIVIDPAFEGMTEEATGEPMDGAASPMLGSPEAPLGTLPQTDLDQLGAGRPLDLTSGGNALATAESAEALYDAGFTAVQRGDYSFAEVEFRQFLVLYPDHPLAPDAANWLGDSLLQREAWDDAAEVLLDGYQTYSASPRAPELLLKLGIALAGAEETDTACRTFAEVPKRYADLTPAFRARLADEITKAQCPT